MIYHAKSGTVSDMDYVSFGSGEKILIMLPGLGDGLSTVKGKSFILAAAYKMYAQKYKVYIFSRKNCLPEVYSTRQMAEDLAEARHSESKCFRNFSRWYDCTISRD